MKGFLKSFLTLFLVFGIAFPISVFAIEKNTGFVANKIWTNDTEYVNNAEVFFYTIVFNGEESDLDLAIDFYNKDEVLVTKEITVGPEESEVVSFGLTLKVGKYEVYGQIKTAQINGQEVGLVLDETQKQKIEIELSLEDIVANAADDVADELNITDQVKEEAQGVFSATENLRENLVEKIEESIEKLDEETEEYSEKNDGEVKGAFKVKSIALKIAKFVSDHAVIFYVLAVFLILQILKKIFRLIRRRARGY
jgi:hypothetical protein